MNIVIAAFDGCLPSGIVGIVDIFAIAERVAADRAGVAHRPWSIRTASLDGRPIRDGRGRELTVDAAFTDIGACDAVLVPGFVPDALARLGNAPGVAEAAQWLRVRHAQGALACGSCSGVFMLGGAGLLDGRRCTTTWWLHDTLKQRFPRADAAWAAPIVEDRRVITAGGPMSWIDLALHVIRELAGPELARAAADFAVVDTAPLTQALYVPQGHLDAADPFLVEATQLVRQAREALNAQQLAQRLSTSERTLHRRLKALSGESPRAFIARVQFENARTLLDTGSASLKEVALSCGYRDEGSFRRAFRQQAGMSPSEYREWSRQRRGA